MSWFIVKYKLSKYGLEKKSIIYILKQKKIQTLIDAESVFINQTIFCMWNWSKNKIFELEKCDSIFLLGGGLDCFLNLESLFSCKIYDLSLIYCRLGFECVTLNVIPHHKNWCLTQKRPFSQSSHENGGESCEKFINNMQ